MKTLTSTLIATFVLGTALTAGAAQRAAAFASELPRVGAAKDTALPAITIENKFAGGKHVAQLNESKRTTGGAKDIDYAHAPRPLTSGKDANLDRKWRANAKDFQVAPLK